MILSTGTGIPSVKFAVPLSWRLLVSAGSDRASVKISPTHLRRMRATRMFTLLQNSLIPRQNLQILVIEGHQVLAVIAGMVARVRSARIDRVEIGAQSPESVVR